MNRTFALAAMAAAMSYAVTAHAADQRMQTEVVAVADLDLGTPAGVRMLDRRILSAVRAACGPSSDADIAGSNAVRRCQKQLLTTLRAQRNKAIAADQGLNVAASR